MPREQRNEEQRKTRLLHITTHLEGKARARRGQLLPIDVLITTLALNASCNTQNEDLKGNGILTLGQSKVKLVVDASVPSRVATATSRVSPIDQYTRQRVLTGDMVHLEVATRHELNFHFLPGPIGVCGPGEGALATDLEDVARARSGGDRVGAHEGRTGNESGRLPYASIVWCILKRESAMGVL